MEEAETIRMVAELPWLEFKHSFKKIAETDQEAALELLILKCATDVELYSVCFFNHYCEREFNDFHLDLFEAFKYGERKVRRVRAAPRGSAKSTLESLIRPIHDVCYGQEEFILFVSSTEELAVPKLKDIRAEILANDALQDVYGVHFPVSKPSVSAFTVISDRGECHFRAAGKNAQIRGIRYREHRPSKLLFDDFESSDEVQNDRLRKKTEDVFHEEFGKTGDTQTNIAFVGTVLHRDALLPKLLANPAYDGKLYQSVISWSEREDLWEKWRVIYRNIDNKNRAADAMAFFKANESEMVRGTKVLWPEKESYLDHMLDMEEIGRRAFFKEKQNQPLGSDEPVFEQIHWYHEEEGGLRIESNNALVEWGNLECIGAMDPATGAVRARKGKLGDFTCVLVGYKDHKGRIFVHHDWTKRAAPTRYISQIFELHEKFEFDRFAVETNLYRNLLLPNILDEKRRRNKDREEEIKIPFYDVVQDENKHERIYRLEPKVNNGYMIFNRALSPEFKSQLDDFPHADNDDCPDCAEILWSLGSNKYKPAIDLHAMSGR